MLYGIYLLFIQQRLHSKTKAPEVGRVAKDAHGVGRSQMGLWGNLVLHF